MALCSLFYYSKPGVAGHDECELTESTQYTSSSFFSVSVSVFRASQSVFFFFFKRVFSLVFHFHKCSQPNINQACFSPCPLQQHQVTIAVWHTVFANTASWQWCLATSRLHVTKPSQKKCKNSSCECLGKRLKDQETCLEKLWLVVICLTSVHGGRRWQVGG